MLIHLFVEIVIAALVYWLITLLPLPEPAPAVLKVIFIIVLILLVLQAFGLFAAKSFLP